MNAVIARTDCDSPKHLCKDWVWSKYVIKVALYQSVILKLPNLFMEKCASRMTTHVIVPRRPIPHYRECELNHMETMV